MELGLGIGSDVDWGRICDDHLFDLYAYCIVCGYCWRGSSYYEETLKVKSKKFYAEANDMQEGWGDTLRSIDKLRERVKKNLPIPFKDAIWIEWAEYRMDLGGGNLEAVEKTAKKQGLYNLRLQPLVWAGALEGIRKTLGINQSALGIKKGAI